MSGMDERAKQFKVAAEAHLTGPALRKEIGTLRRFLFRNQEYRFTKGAQQALYMAIIAHYGNSAAHHASGHATASTAPGTSGSPACAGSCSPSPVTHTMPSGSAAGPGSVGNGDDTDDSADAPILRLLDDALKMPFTVFTSSQKTKILTFYWAVLGSDGPEGANHSSCTASVATRTLSLMDIVDVGRNRVQLSLFTDEGDEYLEEVTVSDATTVKELRAAFEGGSGVSVTVQEGETGATFVSFTVDDV